MNMDIGKKFEGIDANLQQASNDNYKNFDELPSNPFKNRNTKHDISTSIENGSIKEFKTNKFDGNGFKNNTYSRFLNTNPQQQIHTVNRGQATMKPKYSHEKILQNIHDESSFNKNSNSQERNDGDNTCKEKRHNPFSDAKKLYSYQNNSKIYGKENKDRAGANYKKPYYLTKKETKRTDFGFKERRHNPFSGPSSTKNYNKNTGSFPKTGLANGIYAKRANAPLKDDNGFKKKGFNPFSVPIIKKHQNSNVKNPNIPLYTKQRFSYTKKIMYGSAEKKRFNPFRYGARGNYLYPGLRKGMKINVKEHLPHITFTGACQICDIVHSGKAVKSLVPIPRKKKKKKSKTKNKTCNNAAGEKVDESFTDDVEIRRTLQVRPHTPPKPVNRQVACHFCLCEDEDCAVLIDRLVTKYKKSNFTVKWSQTAVPPKAD